MTTVYSVEAAHQQNGWAEGAVVLPADNMGPQDRHLSGWDQQQQQGRQWGRGGGMMMQQQQPGWDNNGMAMGMMMPAAVAASNWQQQQLLRQQQQAATAGWPDRRAAAASEPPLAVQQALAMEGFNADYGSGGGIQAHEVVRTRTAFNNSGPAAGSKRGGLGASGILGAAPQSQQPIAAAAKPTGLMDVKINEAMVSQFLTSQRDQVEERQHSNGGDETPEVTPPVSRETTPVPSDNEEEEDDQSAVVRIPQMPTVQMKLFQRLQTKQQQGGGGSDAVVPQQDKCSSGDGDGDGDNSEQKKAVDSDDEDDVIVNVLKKLDNTTSSGNNSPIDIAAAVAATPPPPPPPTGVTPLLLSNLPKELTNMLAAISAKNANNSASSPQAAPSPPRPPPIESSPAPPPPPPQRRPDPRRQRQAAREEEERLEREKDQRLMALDLGSVFGDLELPPLAPSPPLQTEQERQLADTLGLPFRPHIFNQVAKEIEAGLATHPPMEWLLRAVVVPPPDYSNQRHHCSPAQMELDPRLRRYATNNRSSLAKLKDLPLPAAGPVPKTDPRLKGRRLGGSQQITSPSAADAAMGARRQSSEDSDGNFVYNPAKELNRAKQAAAAQLGHEPQQLRSSPDQDQHNRHRHHHHHQMMDTEEQQLPYPDEEEAAWQMEQEQQQQFFQQPGHQRFPKGGGENQHMLMDQFGSQAAAAAAMMYGGGQFGEDIFNQQQQQFLMQQGGGVPFQKSNNFQGQQMSMRGFAWNHGGGGSAMRQPQPFGRGGGGSFRGRGGEFRGGAGRPPFNQNRGGGARDPRMKEF